MALSAPDCGREACRADERAHNGNDAGADAARVERPGKNGHRGDGKDRESHRGHVHFCVGPASDVAECQPADDARDSIRVRKAARRSSGSVIPPA